MTGNFEELGRSIHFIEDICTPVHVQYEDSTDAVIRAPLHLEFEKTLDKFCKDYSPQINCGFEGFQNLSEVLDFCALNSARNYYLYRDKGEKLFALEKTVTLAILAIKYILSNYNVCQKSVELIQNSKGKNVGLIIRKAKDNEYKNGFDLAVFSSDYRIRVLSNRQIFVFKKPYLGANFLLDNYME